MTSSTVRRGCYDCVASPCVNMKRLHAGAPESVAGRERP
ncbi:Hypothetical protein CAP_3223 [Chondromyces apiculatus DSM 436]|uniref:Uncharacterized protein n=1 Tax=Chondromyces apiculatus DSM 436 TaxID=1192034 RepID=A0A017T9K7_9BACT|nr:Hypothetical protein CAP_3223 [Chondromyces apiculatus DSM 436]